MQIPAAIMRLVVVLSVLVQIYADTRNEPMPPAVATPPSWTHRSLLVAGTLSPESTPARSVVPLEPAAQAAVPTPERRLSGSTERSGFRTERNVYRTKLSKLRLVLLADMLNEIPPPQLELITCLANSSTLNVTTKHCDCETYSCKDLLASSSPSPLNYIQPKRKIHTSCREHCCRKKKFNRSIDPATLENVVVSSLTSSSSSTAHRPRHNTVTVTSPGHRSPSVGYLVAPSGHTNRLPSPLSAGVAASATFRGTTGPPSPGSARDHRDRPLATVRSFVCSNDGINQISISNNRTIIPWLYRVGLIETKHPLCVGALIHPSLILTTAVCVINKMPEKLLVWNGAGSAAATPWTVDERRVGRIMLPEKFTTTFQRLENNIALLLLLPSLPSQDKHPPAAPAWDESTNVPIPIGTGAARVWTVSAQDGRGHVYETEAHPGATSQRAAQQRPDEPEWRRRNQAKAELFAARRKRTPVPASICLSSIIDHPPPLDPASSTARCHTVSFHRRKLPAASGRADAQTLSTQPDDDGTNYVTTNISIFPASECRPEHREYLQHEANLCAGYGVSSNRSIDVDYSGSPLVCDEPQRNGSVHRTVRGLLTWSTDINHAPHLFTNLTTYRPWIERKIEQLEAAAEAQRSGQPMVPIILRAMPYAYPRRSVLYG